MNEPNTQNNEMVHYAEKVVFKEGFTFHFPDFNVRYDGLTKTETGDKIKEPYYTFRNFVITSPNDTNQKLSISFGGNISPHAFTVENVKYLLELDVVQEPHIRLAENEMYITKVKPE